ncbi:hypothetical protein ACN077_08665 [Clostridium chromiireducens]|uniref:Uncharacterized protein n=1 Tax=Clostridium chromiireducens TaxID=225345 RepID=A0A964RNN5_9CLOT|nr:hypothetical protein [Clostridium chromiireducens]MVX65012.1 hypothetical protein [Clostridium chromiireducens]
MYDLKEKIKTVEINLPKGKVVIVLPEDVPVDYSKIKKIEKQQREADLGNSNGVPATISLASVSGDLLQTYRTTDEFFLYFNYISRTVVLKSEHLLARTYDMNLNAIDTKIVSKVVMSLKDFIAARFNFLSLPPQNPQNAPMHVNEIWVADEAIVYNTRNVDDIMFLGHKGVGLVTTEETALFTVLYQNGKVTAENVSTFMIISTKRLTTYLCNTIDTNLS